MILFFPFPLIVNPEKKRGICPLSPFVTCTPLFKSELYIKEDSRNTHSPPAVSVCMKRKEGREKDPLSRQLILLTYLKYIFSYKCWIKCCVTFQSYVRIHAHIIYFNRDHYCYLYHSSKYRKSNNKMVPLFLFAYFLWLSKLMK